MPIIQFEAIVIAAALLFYLAVELGWGGSDKESGRHQWPRNTRYW